MTDERRPLVTVIGEALVDMVPGHEPDGYVARPGGSPYNVAVGLARLGVDVALMARLADNSFGRMLRRRALAEGIDLSASAAADEPTTLAVVSLEPDTGASYSFYLDGTADWNWSEAEIDRVPAPTAALHFGSIASWTPPGAERIATLAGRLRRRGDVLISYDPNVRPVLLGDPGRARSDIESSVGLAHVVKASAEDVAWLYPDLTAADVAGRWLGLGAVLAVVTEGPGGARCYRQGLPPVSCPGRAVAVVDTVGAGDSFTAAMLASLIGRGLVSPQALAHCGAGELAEVFDDAVLASSITCGRAGAQPPTAAEVADRRAADLRAAAHLQSSPH